MKRTNIIIIPLALLLLTWHVAVAQETHGVAVLDVTDSVSISFRQSKWNLDMEFGNNAATLDSINRRLEVVMNDSVYRLSRIRVVGGASPEGSVAFNRILSERRAATLFDWFGRHLPLKELDRSFTFLGRDWEGVLRLAENDPSVPYRDETIMLLRNIAEEKRMNGNEPARSLERIKRLHGGEPYRYLYDNIFPAVRASRVIIGYDRVLSPVIAEKRLDEAITARIDTIFMDRIEVVHDTIYINNCPECRPFYMNLRTNMLLDIAALPNIGVEFYVGRNLSVGAGWMYGWWSRSDSHRYWRAYGGELFGRWWFGGKARQKPLTGHHLGIYAQMYTYDFEWGDKGEMGGKPGGSLLDRAQYGGGIEYGYSLPVGRRINIDFSLGLGYVTGTYHKYRPIDDCYVWQSTHRRHWFGPTKAEISLVWLIGCDNYNRSKARKGGMK